MKGKLLVAISVLLFIMPLAFAEDSDFVLVEGGKFLMGSMDGSPQERPVHRVTVSSFYMCVHEVTQEEYEAVMDKNPSHFQGGRLPVERVSWYDAVEYCNKRSEKEGLTPCYSGSSKRGYTCDFSADGYRLPTEAEWEYAARGGKEDDQTKYSGSDSVSHVAWCGDSHKGRTHEVMGKAPNGLGLYDMSGNVWEWCHDFYAPYPAKPQRNPTGAELETQRIVRGGGWYGDAYACRVSDRRLTWPEEHDDSGQGFRVVRSATAIR
ncbi:MAG: SUMF1/EgtB/PvdO family nonheme iron enzyme [Treponema sp.]|nr:SUMF1/EgtB/PvdO family nonheme iron enzyme [Treponema sp.]